ncbi:MAG TPA: glycosyltransferase, partial [Flavisolibacter sp.]
MPSFLFLSLMNGAAWGGSEELWHRTALDAAGKGYKIGCAFYHWKEKEPKIEALQKAGCQVYLLPNEGRRKNNLKERIHYKWSKRKAKKAVASLPYQEYDLTIVNLGGFEIYTATWKNTYRLLPAYALLFHNYSEEDVYKPVKAERLHQWMKHAAGNFFAAARIKEVLEQKLNITIPNADVVINPITIVPSGAPAPYPVIAPFVFVMLAELDVSRKAQDNLIKALSSPKWKARNWKLFLYGKGKDSQLLQQLITQLSLSGKVELKGHVDQVKTALEQAHLVLQLTHRDAMPLVVAEAMAVGRPVVASKVGDMPLWVREGRNGWIANNASVEEIDSAMERAWQQKEQWP